MRNSGAATSCVIFPPTNFLTDMQKQTPPLRMVLLTPAAILTCTASSTTSCPPAGLDLSELLDSQHHTIFGGGWIYLCEDLFQQTHHVPAPTDPHHPDSGYIVLFQLESYFGDHSDAAFMLADGGVARFYIHHDDLAALDFSKVIYECESS